MPSLYVVKLARDLQTTMTRSLYFIHETTTKASYRAFFRVYDPIEFEFLGPYSSNWPSKEKNTRRGVQLIESRVFFVLKIWRCLLTKVSVKISAMKRLCRPGCPFIPCQEPPRPSAFKLIKDHIFFILERSYELVERRRVAKRLTCRLCMMAYMQATSAIGEIKGITQSVIKMGKDCLTHFCDIFSMRWTIVGPS